MGCRHPEWMTVENTDGGPYRRCVACGLEEQHGLADGETSFTTAQAVFYESEDPACLSPLAVEISRRSARYRLDIVRRSVAPGKRLLEVGPGDGQFAELAASSGYDVEAVEDSAVLADVVRERGIDVRVGTLESADLQPGSVDAVASWHVIEHVPDPVAHLRRAAEVTAPGALAVLATPNAASLGHRVAGPVSPNYTTAHLRLFTEESLTDVLREAGWEPVEVVTTEEPDNWMKVAAAVARRVLGRVRPARRAASDAQPSVATIEQRPLSVQSVPPSLGGALLSIFGAVTWLPRRLQARRGLGNELVVVARKPERR